MYPDPNQNQQYQQPTAQPGVSASGSQPQYSIDYLNQIAPQQQRPGLGNKMYILLVGGGLLVALLVFVLALTSSGSGPTKNMQTFAARVQTLEKIVSNAQKNIRSNDLRGTNSNLSLFLVNADQGMTTPLENNSIKVKNLDKTIVSAESGDALTAKLKDAYLNAVFDRTYAREMSYQLSTLETLMKSIYKSTNSKSLKGFLQTTDDSLVPIKKQFDSFNETSS